MKIDIPFNDWSKERLRKGLKIATSRTKKYGKIGDYFEVEIDGSKRYYQIFEIIRHPLGYVQNRLYIEEGARSPAEFRAVWIDIHPRRGFRAGDLVYTHFFQPIEREPPIEEGE